MPTSESEMFKRIVKFPTMPPPLNHQSENDIPDTQFTKELQESMEFYGNLKFCEECSDVITKLAFKHIVSPLDTLTSRNISFLERIRIRNLVSAFDGVMYEVAESEQ